MTDISILLLSEGTFLSGLQDLVQQAGPQTKVYFAENLDQLKERCLISPHPYRLVAFCTDVIVPGPMLDIFRGGAYNFHPGPPSYPGIFPSCFAIYDQVREFGVTAHRMTEDIDAGEIVATKSFAIPGDIERFTLDQIALKSLIELFGEISPQLVLNENFLDPSGDQWTGPVRTRKNFEALCELPERIDQTEFQRRYRAVGEGPNHALTFMRFGHRFNLDNNRDDETTYIGGKPNAPE